MSETPVSAPDPIAQAIFNYKDEAEAARRNRYLRNRENFECYHLRQDYSHKKRGQSKEFLAKQSVITEQMCSFLQQGLMDLGDWFRIDLEDGVEEDKQKIGPKTIEKLLLRQLDKNNFPNFFNDTLKLGLLGSLMIIKVGGKFVNKCEYEARGTGLLGLGKKELFRKEKQVWQLELSLIRQEDYFPDPTGDGLYEIQRIEMDWHALKKFALDNPDSGFDIDAINNVTTSTDDLQASKKSRETGQNITLSQYRRRVTIYECWGDIVEKTTGEVLHENVVCAIDAQGNVIRKPTKNPFWHGESPFVVSPIIRVPGSVWHKALMDAATKHNTALNELYNLSVDASMMSVHGIKQIRTNYLENSNQVVDGIAPGTTLVVNSSCPPGAKVLERVDTSALTPESMTMMQMINKELQESSFSNESRMGGVSQRQIKATEIVASNQSLTGILNGIVKVIEGEAVSPLLVKSWLTMAQHMNDLDCDEVKALVGQEQARYVCNQSPEEIFAQTATGHVYKVFGLSTTLNKIQDFRKIQALLQSIGASPQMMQEFTRKYSMTRLLGEIIKSLDIDDEKLIATPQEQMQRQQEMAMQAQAEQGGNTQGGEGTNPQSQIPQAASSSQEVNPMHGFRGANINTGMTTPGM